MRNDRLIAYILIGLMAALFAYAGFQMIKVRSEVTGTYPEYSSFRADPKGYRILFETLSGFDTIRVERFLDSFEQLPSAAGKILLLAGLEPPSKTSSEQTKFFDNWMANGGTLVITFSSLQTERDQRNYKAGIGKEENSPLYMDVGGSENWGFRILYSNPSLFSPLQTNLFAKQFSWAGHLYIEPKQGDWEIMAKARDLPVVLQRKYGAGKLVLLADAYPLSNAALAAGRNAELVSWLFPQHSTVIFDESHFGIVNHPGVVSLARRYGLDGALITILALAGLYLWASRYRLRPAPKIRSDTNPAVRGIGGNEVFINLLRRTVSAKDLCATCLLIWKQKGPTNPVKQARLEDLLSSLPPTTSPVERYNQIVKLQHS